MRLAVLTPLPPIRSGIAGYARLLLPHLAKKISVVAVVDQESVDPIEGLEVIDLASFRQRRESFDAVLGQLGNNPFHEFIFDEAMRHPMHVVLHDAVLHHLVVEKTLARGDAAAYEELALSGGGAAAAAFARGRAMGLHLELGNFLFPLSAGLARRSRGVIVHNRWAGEQLRGDGVDVPIVVAGHPFDDSLPRPSVQERAQTREELGFAPEDRVIGMFGFVTGAKRPEAVFESFARAGEIDPRLRLLVVGEPAPNVDLESLARRSGADPARWKSVGWVDDPSFDRYLAATDRVVNLRYPSAGEMSGPFIRALQFGIPIAVSHNAQFADVPREVAVPIPLTEDEIPALVSFMTRPIDAPLVATAQRRWLEEHGAVDRVVDAYLRSLEGKDDIPVARRAARSALPLLWALSVERLDAIRQGSSLAISFRIRNGSDSLCRAAAFGEPALRIVVKVHEGNRVVADRWVAPEADLSPGGVWDGAAQFELAGEAGTVSITPAISETTEFPRPPLAVATIRRGV